MSLLLARIAQAKTMPAFVGNVSAQGGDINTDTFTATVTSDVARGAFVVAAIKTSAGLGVQSISDTRGHVWNWIDAGSSQSNTILGYALLENGWSVGDYVTVTVSSVHYMNVTLHAFAGVRQLDNSAVAVVASQPITAGPASATLRAYEMAVTTVSQGNVPGDTPNLTPSAGWIQLSSMSSLAVAYQIVPHGDVSVTWQSALPNNMAAVLAVFA